MGVLRLLTDEALAYLKLGLLMPARSRLGRRNATRSELGVVFIPGVGANGSQFLMLEEALSEETDHFTAFEYTSLRSIETLAAGLAEHIETVARRCERVMLVGHSLGGVLGRIVLQREVPPPNVVAFASICAPLHGTWRSKLLPPPLRSLAPDGVLMQSLFAHADRMNRWRGKIVTIGARHDQFIDPHTSALLDGHEQLLLEDVAHAGSLFDRRVHGTIAALARRASQ
jgi:pimeloyl-ACP methyl ester carboxylesterase